jgi:hypothetical protein
MSQMLTSLLRLVHAAAFLLGLFFSFIPVTFLFASVSVGAWCEEFLQRIGYTSRPDWLPPLVGVLGYTGFGVVGPAYLGGLLLGWPGVVLGPLIMLIVVAVLGKW